MAGRRNTGPTLGILAAVTVVALAAILFVVQSRSPDPEAVPPTTLADGTTTSTPPTTLPLLVTTTVPRLVVEPRGTPFDWGSTLEIDGRTPLALIEHDNLLYLFTATPAPPGTRIPRPTGLQTWASTDGTTWEQRSGIPDDYEIHTVISSVFGLVAAGFDPVTGDGMVWQSADGTDWAATVASPGIPTRWGHITSSVATDDLVYFLAEMGGQTDMRRVETALTDHGHEFEDTSLWYDGADRDVLLFGPLGVPLGRVPFEEIGLTVEDVEGTAAGQETLAWLTRDGSTWSPHAQPTRLQWPFVGIDGIVRAQHPDSSTVVGSFNTSVLDLNALTWTREGTPALAEVLHQWPGGFLGRNPQVLDQVAMSADGLSWRNLSPASLLPRGETWRFWAVGGGERGIALGGTASTGPVIETEVVEWEQDGYRIVAESHAFEVFDGETSILRAPRYSTGERGLTHGRWDSTAGTLELLDPDTGESVVTLVIDEVAARLPNQGGRPEVWLEGRAIGNAFLFSHSETWPTPGVITTERGIDTWTVQDLGGITSGELTHLLVLEDRVVLVASGKTNTELFVALIPEAP